MMPPCTACRRSERLRERIKQIYIDNLDGRIEETIFNALTAQFREQEERSRANWNSDSMSISWCLSGDYPVRISRQSGSGV